MIHETENPQEANGVCLGSPARQAYADPGRYITQSPQCWFSLGTVQLCRSEGSVDNVCISIYALAHRSLC